MTRKVQAARLHEFGEPMSIEEVDIGDPDQGEVVVSLEFAGVNPIDRYLVSGEMPSEGPLPRTMGSEASGTVDGKRVLVFGEGIGKVRDGTYANAIVAPRDAVVEIPDGVDMASAATCGVAGLTANELVYETVCVRTDDRVLVLGAGGGVGLAVTSLAAALGATVWGQVGTESKAAAVTEAGAANVVVARAGELAKATKEFEPTVIIDPLGGDFVSEYVEAAANYARVGVYGTSAGKQPQVSWQQLYRKNLVVKGYSGLLFDTAQRREGLRRTLQSLVSEHLKLPVTQTFLLGRVNEAFDVLASRSVTGKVVIDLRSN